MPSIHTLIPLVMGEIGAIGKDRKNEQQNYKFRGIEDFYNAAHPALVKHGVFCVPEVLEYVSQEREGLNARGERKVSFRMLLKVRHRFFGPDGDSVDVVTLGEGIDTADKASNKAMSAAMKYALIELFSVPTQDVEDGDRTSPEMPPKPIEPKRTTAPRPLPTKPESAVPQAPAEREPGSDDEEEPTIDLPKQKALHMAFGNACPPEVKNKDAHFRGWLKSQGYIGADGEGTTKTIPVSLYAEVTENAKKFARTLKGSAA